MSTFEDVLNRLEQIFSDQNIYAHGLRREYNRGNRGAGTHNGQLKLWFADLMAFLTYLIDYQQCPKIILVIGAADGEHWTNPEFAERVFTKMGKIQAFQDNPIMPLKAVFDLIAQNRGNTPIQYHFYDTAPFHKSVNAIASAHSSNLHLHPQLFEQQDCDTYTNEDDVLMLCDIRTDAHGKAVRSNNTAEAERLTQDDMYLQLRFAQGIQANLSALKYRAPWYNWRTENDEFLYANGTLYAQLFAAPNTTEQRLMIRKKQLQQQHEWDTKKIEETCHHYNTRLRGGNHQMDERQAYLIWQETLKLCPNTLTQTHCQHCFQTHYQPTIHTLSCLIGT